MTADEIKARFAQYGVVDEAKPTPQLHFLRVTKNNWHLSATTSNAGKRWRFSVVKDDCPIEVRPINIGDTEDGATLDAVIPKFLSVAESITPRVEKLNSEGTSLKLKLRTP